MLLRDKLSITEKRRKAPPFRAGLWIGYLETPDFEQAFARMAISDINQRWQREMADFFEGAPGRVADEQMSPIPEIFHLP